MTPPKRVAPSIRDMCELAEIIRKVIPHRHEIKTLSRIWQSVRFEVNEELEQLREVLEKVAFYLRGGGRIVVISYESLMDRMVKRFLRGESPTFLKNEIPMKQKGIQFRKLTRQIIRPSEIEIMSNPRARSARMRAGEKVDYSED